jgi:quinoprotein glucose dehydrogenase
LRRDAGQRVPRVSRKTGKVLWESYLGGGAFATPSTYLLDGKQYVVVPVSDNLNTEKSSPEGPYKIGDFVAFTLS